MAGLANCCVRLRQAPGRVRDRMGSYWLREATSGKLLPPHRQIRDLAHGFAWAKDAKLVAVGIEKFVLVTASRLAPVYMPTFIRSKECGLEPFWLAGNIQKDQYILLRIARAVLADFLGPLSSWRYREQLISERAGELD
jgi:hypothetical protein